MARVRVRQTPECPALERGSGGQPRSSTAPWFFEATLKQEIQRRKQRRWRATALVRLVTRVVIPGSMIMFVILCSMLVLL